MKNIKNKKEIMNSVNPSSKIFVRNALKVRPKNHKKIFYLIISVMVVIVASIIASNYSSSNISLSMICSMFLFQYFSFKSAISYVKNLIEINSSYDENYFSIKIDLNVSYLELKFNLLVLSIIFYNILISILKIINKTDNINNAFLKHLLIFITKSENSGLISILLIIYFIIFNILSTKLIFYFINKVIISFKK